MIFPLLRGFLSIRKAPVTWLIFGLNTAVLLWGWAVAWSANDRLDQLMGNDFFIETQGHVYENFLKEHSDSNSGLVRELASTGATDINHYRLLGQLAFRDETFLDEAPHTYLFNDEVAFQQWKKQLKRIRHLEEIHPSFLLGISTDATNFKQWVTYIFSHTSGWHYLGNMIFLLIFGGALEEIIGGLGLLVVFVSSGVFAGGFFLWLCGTTTAPLIGASGAISGIMAMFCVLRWNQSVRFVYWLFLPTKNAMGFLFLPAWAGLVFWLLGDLAGYFGNLDIMGGVAHAAHLGGDLAGALAGLVVIGLWKWRDPKRLVAPHLPIEPWRLYPFFQTFSVRRSLTR